MPNIQNVVIVGGGPSAIALMDQFAVLLEEYHIIHPLKNTYLKIIVIDKQSLFGKGFPYSDFNALPEHTLGRTRTTRLKKGSHLERRFYKAQNRLQQQAEVELRPLDEVIDLDPLTESQSWQVELASGELLLASHVILATGHWDSSSPMAEHEGYFDSPWPVNLIQEQILPNQHVILMGAFQTGLDAAVSLALQNGKFVTDPYKGFIYHKKAGCEQFRLTLCSRHGFFPRVVGHTQLSQDSPFIIMEQLPMAKEAGGGFIALDTIYQLIWEKFSGAGIAEQLKMSYPGIGGENFDHDLLIIQQQLSQRDPHTDLKQSVQKAQESIKGKISTTWLEILWDNTESFYSFFPWLSAEDRLRLERVWTTVFGFVEAINLVMAQRILALMDAGVLQITALGEHPTVTHISPQNLATDTLQDSFSVKGEGVSLTAPYFIDCTGQKLSVEHSTSLLLKNLLNKGMIQSAQIPFRSQNTEINYSSHKDRKRGVVKQIADHQVYCSGGIFVDPNTLSVIPSPELQEASPKCYAIGPLTIGQFPIYPGLYGTRFAAKKIVPDILENLLGNAIS
ncbi:MAG: hypothetical protein DRR19_12495 [Candidatus Parabeggiatoa sp. nov. 1]|nr:MAG: hypothetical protein DRR19_12495 [Gammaproteobacteria bacterium]